MSVFLFWSVTKIDRIAKTFPPHPPFILILIVILILKIASKLAFVRIRVAHYRIIYDIFDDVLLVDVIDLGHRKDIYE